MPAPAPGRNATAPLWTVVRFGPTFAANAADSAVWSTAAVAHRIVACANVPPVQLVAASLARHFRRRMRIGAVMPAAVKLLPSYTVCTRRPGNVAADEPHGNAFDELPAPATRPAGITTVDCASAVAAGSAVASRARTWRIVGHGAA